MRRTSYFILNIVFALHFALCAGCNRRLTIQTIYLDQESLASYYVGTPDPDLKCPNVGERLIINWTLKEHELRCKKPSLHLTIRLRNREERKIYIPMTYPRGYYTYDIVNEEYAASGGILTYKAEVMSEGEVIEAWLHPLWMQLIRFNLDE